MSADQLSTGGDEVRLHADQAELCRAAAAELLHVLDEAVRQRGTATAVLTGGGTGTGILAAVRRLLEDQEAGTEPDWTRVHLWWGDERLVPAGDAERNDAQADAALIDWLRTERGLLDAHVHRMPSWPEDSGPQGTTPAGRLDVLARQHAAELAADAARDPGPDARLPRFDVVLLGVGPDAHVASLFPARPGPAVTGRTVIPVEDSPKPPPLRLSLTVEALGTAERVWFVVAGAEKAPAVAGIRSARDAGETSIEEHGPAVAVSGRAGSVWWLDRAAAGMTQTP